jgi:hypothetical protein
MVKNAKSPGWMKLANRVVVALQKRGLVTGTVRLLSVPGRKIGEMRTTPVPPLVLEGRRYIVGLVELPEDERAFVLREISRGPAPSNHRRRTPSRKPPRSAPSSRSSRRKAGVRERVGKAPGAHTVPCYI